MVKYNSSPPLQVQGPLNGGGFPATPRQHVQVLPRLRLPRLPVYRCNPALYHPNSTTNRGCVRLRAGATVPGGGGCHGNTAVLRVSQAVQQTDYRELSSEDCTGDICYSGGLRGGFHPNS